MYVCKQSSFLVLELLDSNWQAISIVAQHHLVNGKAYENIETQPDYFLERKSKLPYRWRRDKRGAICNDGSEKLRKRVLGGKSREVYPALGRVILVVDKVCLQQVIQNLEGRK